MSLIPYGKQFIDQSDIDAVAKALKNDLITTGPLVKKLEKKVSKILKVKYVIACSSGTAALHLAFMAINLQKGDNIIMPTINFTAAANIAHIMKANIYLSDVNPDSGLMTEKNLYECIKKNNLKSLKAFLPMYVGGNAENNFNLKRLKKKYKTFCIEDACHALGSIKTINNKKYNVGSCIDSDICTFSLHPLKSITSGEGGLITTNSSDIAKKLRSFRSHGIEKNNSNWLKDKKNYDNSKKPNIWYYQVQKVGLNYRLSDINCALAYSQLNKLKKFILDRKKISRFYNKFFSSYKVFSIQKNKIENSSCHLYSLKIPFKKLRIDRNKFMKYLLDNKITTQVHYIPIYYHPVFKYLKKKWFIGTEKYYSDVISLPIYYKLNYSKIKYICKTILKMINKK